VEVARAIYSVPGNLIGSTLSARADTTTVKLYKSGQLVKVHPRVAPGGRVTDPEDLPQERTTYALRDIEHLIVIGRSHGRAISAYVEAVLDHPLPWTKMRQAYRLLGLVKKWGPEKVELACARALEAEAVNVNLVSRMIERATEADENAVPVQPTVVQGRFARDPSEFCATAEVTR